MTGGEGACRVGQCRTRYNQVRNGAWSLAIMDPHRNSLVQVIANFLGLETQLPQDEQYMVQQLQAYTTA